MKKNFLSMFGRNLTLGSWKTIKNMIRSVEFQALIAIVVVVVTIVAVLWVFSFLIRSLGLYGVPVFGVFLYVLINFWRTMIQYYEV